MPKSHTIFICQQCSYESVQWMGKCPGCGTWNSLVETLVQGEKTGKNTLRSSSSGVAQLQKLSEIKEIGSLRISTGMEELDRVLGGPSTSSGQGGIVPGSVILLAGEPGIGKSTLLLQVAANIASPKTPNAPNNPKVIYVSGEESPEQIKIRAQRLGIKSDNLYFLNETDVDAIVEQVSRVAQVSQVPRVEKARDTRDTFDSRGTLMIVDSIQTLYTEDLSGLAGSVGQVRECASRLLRLAKSKNLPLFLVGHVTKEGAVAGPMVLSHIVDTVLFFEGERFQSLRLLRAIKNRFGPTDESGVFEMTDSGLKEVNNPSELFLGERTKNVSGSIVTCLLEGSRPLLVEIQALAVPTQLAIPRRVGQGINFNRLQLLVAVLSRRVGLTLGTFDIFVNVAGGIKIEEPAADLAICLAIASAFTDKPLDSKICAIGEVGLLGEIRAVGNLEKRIKEAKRLGFTKIVSPKDTSNLRGAIKDLLR